MGSLRLYAEVATQTVKAQPRALGVSHSGSFTPFTTAKIDDELAKRNGEKVILAHLMPMTFSVACIREQGRPQM